MPEIIRTRHRLEARWVSERLDVALAALHPEHSRARLQAWTRAGAVRVDGRTVKPNYRIQGGELVELDVELEAATVAAPEAIELSILYEDAELFVLNKPAGLVVHPAPGNPDGTLQNALLHRDPALAALPRAGIVHRLDKLTSGVMVVARTLEAHTALVRQLQARTVAREYRALVHGALVAGETIDAPIGRHPRDRKRMAVVEAGRPAVTHYRVARRFRDFSLLNVKLETGRTHQIRVHLTHVGHPLVGDPVYGGRPRLPAGASDRLISKLSAFRRQALHARHLAFDHPTSGAPVSCSAPWPEDMMGLLAAMEADPGQHDRP